MAWFITGDRRGIALVVSGVPTCHGQGAHEPKPPGLNDFGGNVDYQLLSRLQRSECAWSIALPNDSDVHIDPGGEGLLERVREAPEQSHGMIKFLPGTPDLVGFSVVVPEKTFVHIWRLLDLCCVQTRCDTR
jgi:hypothetical protein